MKVVLTSDQKLLSKAFSLRREIFVVEQNVPPELETDEDDEKAFHAVALENEDVVATGRLVIKGGKGKIGRMAVKKGWRGKGLGKQILKKLMEKGEEKGIKHFYLDSQVHAKEFYAKEGFAPVGEIFEEAGIPHQRMEYHV